jgi:hypothetical protein
MWSQTDLVISAITCSRSPNGSRLFIYQAASRHTNKHLFVRQGRIFPSAFVHSNFTPKLTPKVRGRGRVDSV